MTKLGEEFGYLLIDPKSMKIIKTPGDGNCFYYSALMHIVLYYKVRVLTKLLHIDEQKAQILKTKLKEALNTKNSETLILGLLKPYGLDLQKRSFDLLIEFLSNELLTTLKLEEVYNYAYQQHSFSGDNEQSIQKYKIFKAYVLLRDDAVAYNESLEAKIEQIKQQQARIANAIKETKMDINPLIDEINPTREGKVDSILDSLNASKINVDDLNSLKKYLTEKRSKPFEYSTALNLFLFTLISDFHTITVTTKPNSVSVEMYGQELSKKVRPIIVNYADSHYEMIAFRQKRQQAATVPS